MLSAGGGWGVSVGGMWGGRGDSEMEEKEGLVVKEKDTTSSSSSSTGVRAVLKEEYSSERVRGGIRRRRSKSLPHRPTGGHSRLLLLIFVTGSRRENVSKDEEKRGKVKLPPYRRLLPFLQDSPAAFSADRKCPVFQTSVVLGG